MDEGHRRGRQWAEKDVHGWPHAIIPEGEMHQSMGRVKKETANEDESMHQKESLDWKAGNKGDTTADVGLSHSPEICDLVTQHDAAWRQRHVAKKAMKLAASANQRDRR